MSRALITLAVEDAAEDPMGAKETVAMALEHLGGVRVLRVEVQTPEQQRIDGVIPSRRTAPPPAIENRGGGQARSCAAKDLTQCTSTRIMACCNCALYRQDPGWDGGKIAFYGRCLKNGRAVYRLFDLCRAWEGQIG